MPFIAEAEFPTTYATVEELKQQYGFEYLRRNVRLCAELGIACLYGLLTALAFAEARQRLRNKSPLFQGIGRRARPGLTLPR